MLKVAVAVGPATLLRFHRALVRRKYQWLFSASTRRRPGPKGPSKELIGAILEVKRLNPRFGCPRIAQQISHAFGQQIDKDVVRRILANHPLPTPGGSGPSWLSAIAEARDSLWSVDLFRCESILPKSFWVMVVMDVRPPPHAHCCVVSISPWSGCRRKNLPSMQRINGECAQRLGALSLSLAVGFTDSLGD